MLGPVEKMFETLKKNSMLFAIVSFVVARFQMAGYSLFSGRIDLADSHWT
jgi:hypothetical protein